MVKPSGVNRPVSVYLKFHSLTPLYQSFFSNTKAVSTLGTDLGRCLTQGVDLLVAWDLENRQGRLTLVLPPGTSACLPRLDDQAVDLSPLIPIAAALADYRDKLAASYDLRLSSFTLGLQFTRGNKTCLLVPEGDHPPSGRLFAPCLGLGGTQCALEQKPGTRFTYRDDAMKSYIRACFSR